MHNSPKPLYRSEQIRRAERIAIDDLGLPGLQLMRNAGKAAFVEFQRRWPTTEKLTVFCGAGNNGGDGYVIARLALQSGIVVRVYAISAPESLSGDAHVACRDFLQAGGEVERFTDESPAPDGVIVDALLGTGLNRPVGDDFSRAITAINASDCPVLAVDVPSGLHADTGNVLGCAVKADLTVTFMALKCGLFTGRAAEHCGEIVSADLAVPPTVFDGMEPAAHLLQKIPLARRSRDAHKGHFGHVLLVGGNIGYSGAIRLAGEAALRSGAGLVSIASRVEHSALLNIGRPELMCHGIEYPMQLHVLLAKASVVVIGPGLGQDDWAHSLLAEVLATGKPCVLDADALNLLARRNDRPRENWILTPHPGEAARLLNCPTNDIAVNRFAAARAIQSRHGGVCVLKGAGSLVVTSKTVDVAVNGNPGMASGGMGDVLSGVAGALLAQGLQPADAARLAVYVHGEAADSAAEAGERGMLAGDLLPEIRRCLNEG